MVSFALTREEAIDVMKRCLAEYIIAPLKTTIPLYSQVMDEQDFRDGNFDTSYIERFLPEEEDDDDEDDDE